MSHDVVEVVSGNESVVVQICLGENVLDLVVGQVLSQFLGDLLQFEGGESSCSVDIEALENLVNLSSAFLVTKFGSGESQELSEIDTSGLIVIEFGEDLIYEFVLSSKSEAFESSL